MLTLSVRKGNTDVAKLSLDVSIEANVTGAMVIPERLRAFMFHLKGLTELQIVETPGQKAYFDELWETLYQQARIDNFYPLREGQKSFTIGLFTVNLTVENVNI